MSPPDANFASILSRAPLTIARRSSPTSWSCRSSTGITFLPLTDSRCRASRRSFWCSPERGQRWHLTTFRHPVVAVPLSRRIVPDPPDATPSTPRTPVAHASTAAAASSARCAASSVFDTPRRSDRSMYNDGRRFPAGDRRCRRCVTSRGPGNDLKLPVQSCILPMVACSRRGLDAPGAARVGLFAHRASVVRIRSVKGRPVNSWKEANIMSGSGGHPHPAQVDPHPRSLSAGG